MYRSIKFRLALLLFIPIFFFVLTAVTQQNTISSNLHKMTNSLYETSFKANDLVQQADRDMYQALRDYDLLRLAKLDQAAYDQIAKDFRDNAQQVRDRLAQASDILKKRNLLGLQDPDSKRTAGDLLNEFQAGIEEWLKAAAANVESRSPADGEQEIALAQKFESSRAAVDAMGNILSRYAESETAGMKNEMNSTRTITWSALIVEWIAIIVLGLLLIRYLGRSLNRAVNKTKLVAAGNLQSIPDGKYRKDELGQLNEAVDTMIEKMRGLVGKIIDNTQTVSASAVELSVSAQESAAASNHVAENIQEVTSQVELQATISDESSRAVEEMAVGVQRIAENTSAISDYSATASEQVDQGNARVQTLRVQMHGIYETIQSLSQIVKQLTDKSEQIGQITENITGFANQTNILSFNASIEAARAGEHGKGFAVVAQEIRKLAAGSIESAEVISNLIAETREEISNASKFMDTTMEQAEKGHLMMSDVERDFAAILQAVKQVTVQVHETSAITEQMSASSEEVSASMEQSSNTAREVAGKAQTVAAATEEQLALMENISHASEQLQHIVRSLKESVSQFKL
ncbi:methyl-accepting chemotaxis protein [Cohnella xylanilytica]|uniref:Methyl-accepting chemotaxis protein n=1 Tax=Cohnella xylanilytica TaxID=557555 RepID=A0A841U347_9BACL|nr:methyl-accepting chemotaxis protein [Cohnella xylanilytica]MBB6692531.1 methyl-accepting chemotaxis protein [Cohnella xylanilytica]